MSYALRTVLALFLFGALLGCSKKTHISNPDELRCAISTDILTLDPANASERNTTDVLKQVVETLVQLDSSGKPVPCVARSWSVSPDGKTYTFQLGKHTFSDGSPVTAEDVQASFQRVFVDEVKSALGPNYLGDIANSQVVDANTLVVTLKTPARSFLAKLSYPVCSILPKRFLHRAIQDSKDLIGSGPYVVASYSPKQRIVLVPNRYWGSSGGAYKKIEVLPIVDGATRLSMFRSGDLDICPVPVKDVPGVDADPSLKGLLRNVPQAKLIYLQFNSTTMPALENPIVRRAMAMAVDRKRIVESLMFGKPKLANRYVLPHLNEPDWAWPYDFNPEEARRLLSKAGYPNGQGFPAIQIACNETNRNMPAVEAIATDLKSNLGINAQVHVLTSAGLMDMNQKHQLAVFFTGWTADFDDPENTLDGLFHSQSGSNGSGFANARVDQLLDAASTEADPLKRSKRYREAEQKIVQEVPILPLFFPVDSFLFSHRVNDLQYTSFGFQPILRR